MLEELIKDNNINKKLPEDEKPPEWFICDSKEIGQIITDSMSTEYLSEGTFCRVYLAKKYNYRLDNKSPDMDFINKNKQNIENSGNKLCVVKIHKVLGVQERIENIKRNKQNLQMNDEQIYNEALKICKEETQARYNNELIKLVKINNIIGKDTKYIAKKIATGSFFENIKSKKVIKKVILFDICHCDLHTFIEITKEYINQKEKKKEIYMCSKIELKLTYLKIVLKCIKEVAEVLKTLKEKLASAHLDIKHQNIMLQLNIKPEEFINIISKDKRELKNKLGDLVVEIFENENKNIEEQFEIKVIDFGPINPEELSVKDIGSNMSFQIEKLKYLRTPLAIQPPELIHTQVPYYIQFVKLEDKDKDMIIVRDEGYEQSLLKSIKPEDWIKPDNATYILKIKDKRIDIELEKKGIFQYFVDKVVIKENENINDSMNFKIIRKWTESADIYSLACIMSELLTFNKSDYPTVRFKQIVETIEYRYDEDEYKIDRNELIKKLISGKEAETEKWYRNFLQLPLLNDIRKNILDLIFKSIIRIEDKNIKDSYYSSRVDSDIFYNNKIKLNNNKNRLEKFLKDLNNIIEDVNQIYKTIKDSKTDKIKRIILQLKIFKSTKLCNNKIIKYIFNMLIIILIAIIFIFTGYKMYNKKITILENKNKEILYKTKLENITNSIYKTKFDKLTVENRKVEKEKDNIKNKLEKINDKYGNILTMNKKLQIENQKFLKENNLLNSKIKILTNDVSNLDSRINELQIANQNTYDILKNIKSILEKNKSENGGYIIGARGNTLTTIENKLNLYFKNKND